MRRSGLSILLVLTAVAMGDSCSNSPTAPTIASLTVSPDTLRLHHGDSQLLNVAALDGSGQAVTGASLTFTAADTSVAIVSAAGLVTAKKAGNTTVTVSSGSAHQTAVVFVLAGAKTVQASPMDTTIHLGGAYALSVTVLDSANLVIVGAPVAFGSLDTTVVRVTPAGAVSGIGVGTTHVGVTSGPANVFVNVRVIDTIHTPAFILSGPSDTTVATATTYQLHTVVSDSVHVPINAPVSYATVDSTVALVSATGVVRAIGAGITTVQVTSGPIVVADTVHVVDSSIVATPSLSGSPYGVAASHGGVVYVLQHTANMASRFNLPGTSAVTSIGLDDNPTYVAFDSAGAVAYVTAQGANLVQVVDVSTNTVSDSIAVTGSPFVVKVSPDDQSIWVSTNVDSLYQIDRTTKTVLAAYGLSLVPNGLAFNPANDSMLYASTLSSGTVVEINYKRKTMGRTFNVGGTAQGVVVSADGTRLYVANESTNRVDAINLSAGNAAGFVATSGGGAFDLQLSTDGTQLWASLSGAGRVDVYDRATLTLVRTVKTGGTPRRIGLTPASGLIVVGNEAGAVDFIK